jgi:hypothetical protein
MLPKSASPMLHVRLNNLLNEEFSKAAISKSEFARRLGVDEKQVRRLLDIGTVSSPFLIEAAFNALGLTVHVETKQQHKRKAG